MAKRYSGNLTINVTYDDRNIYRTSVSRGGEALWSGTVRPAPAGFGPGIAYDSPRAYDEIAQTAIAFAEDEKGGIADEAEVDEQMTGYQVRRSPRGKAAHATKRTSKIAVGDCVTMRSPHRKFLTSTTGGTVFKVLSIDGRALTLEGPMDHHPKHRRQHVMGEQQFKRVACPVDEFTSVHHATKKSPARLDREIAEALAPKGTSTKMPKCTACSRGRCTRHYGEGR